ncbi:hypothetical protein ACHAXR_009359, partial [Thalassiosira sp. AJA248-18]
MSSSQKRVRYTESSPRGKTTKCARKKVAFAQGEPEVHRFDPYNGHGAPVGSSTDINAGEEDGNEGSQRTSQLTEELTLLSTVHGRARRELRDISKHDLKTVMKYGTKTRGWMVNGDQRWKFEFGNTIYITDNSCRKEVTCYKKPIAIEHAKITQTMLDNHKEAERILKDDPHLCTTHSIIIIDQSASMKTCDVNGFRSRSDAAYGTLALDYIAEQLYQQGDEFFVDAVTIIEMNDFGSLLVHKEPLDWILFNKVLDRMLNAKPKSHGNYVESLEFAESVIQGELESYEDLDTDDIPAFMLVLISDGKPSDKLPEHQRRRLTAITRLSQKLKKKLTVFGMGIGASGSDFEQLELLVDTAEECGAEGTFNHAGLNPASLSTSLSSMAMSMTTTRNDLLSTKDGKHAKKTEKTLHNEEKELRGFYLVPLFRKETKGVSRWLYDPRTSYPWRQVNFFNHSSAGFDIELHPFGKGAERLAYQFYEIKRKPKGVGWGQVGKVMVAKESRFVEDEESKESFHTDFCRVQHKAKELAQLFNEAVTKAPLLQPSQDEVSLPPPLDFLRCSVYEYTNDNGVRCGLLVERYLKGKFTKYNGNNGYVNDSHDGTVIDLAIGEVKNVDFVQAFSHWVYVNTNHKLLVCDLQGILDLEGRRPIFRLTDPAICSKGGKRNRYGKTDLGMRGIRNFCRFHKCNGVCKALSLPPMRKRGH